MTMSNSMRRVFSSCRQLSVMLHSHTHYFPFTPSSLPFNSNPITHPASTCTTFLFQPTRGFCNNQTYGDNDSDDEDGGIYGTVDFGNAVKSVARAQMEAALEALPRDWDKLPTRATAGMRSMDDVKYVPIKGVKIPFKKMADVSVMDSTSLSITPYDPNTIKGLVEAITARKYGIYAWVQEEKIIADMPRFTDDDKQDLVRLAIKSSEHVKQSIRRVRQKALETIRKSIPKRKEKEKASLSISGFTASDAQKLEKEQVGNGHQRGQVASFSFLSNATGLKTYARVHVYLPKVGSGHQKAPHCGCSKSIYNDGHFKLWGT
ncbi:hypothetical protein POM88_043875 [Heracleum sosnowskyi]|uniref:Ribosome-recycling factor, chloroplastic n=1 Tax=Heracleum sosnowskyi TaxID=360622 RepID=A0AAD8M3G6_9APIA|nr:hypothetical protein POM88_043875 [Heracleum sosnowskyi]